MFTYCDYDFESVLRRQTCYLPQEMIIVTDYYPTGTRKELSHFTWLGELKTVWGFDAVGRVTSKVEYECGARVESFEREYGQRGTFEQITYNDLGEAYLWCDGVFEGGRSRFVESKDLLPPEKRAAMRLRNFSRLERKMGRNLVRPDAMQLRRGFVERSR